MQKDEIIKKLKEYIDITNNKAPGLKVAFVTSIQNETPTLNDFSTQSVCTSYLSRADCNELLNAFRENNIYTELYIDCEEFFKSFYSKNFNCNIVFETSPQGIAKGKDALIPSFCDSVGFPHVGPDAASVLRCGNKYQWYCALKNNSLPVPDTYLFTNHWANIPPKKGKFILKLNEECASIGLTQNSVFYNDLNNMTAKAEELLKVFNEPLIAQQFISGYEVEVPVLSNKNTTLVLPPIGLKYGHKKLLNDTFFNYDLIYDNGYGVYIFEEDNAALSEHIREITKSVVDILNLNGFFRIDYRVAADGKPYVIDINNDPTLNMEGSFQHSVNFLGFGKKELIAIILGNYFANQSKIEHH